MQKGPVQIATSSQSGTLCRGLFVVERSRFPWNIDIPWNIAEYSGILWNIAEYCGISELVGCLKNII